MSKFKSGWVLVAFPGIVVLATLFLYPIAVLFSRSVTDPGPENFVNVLAHPSVHTVMINTVRMSFIVVVSTLIFGTIYAYVLARLEGLLKNILLAVILFPLLTSWIVRTLAITVMIQDSGLINDGLVLLGFGRIEMIRTDLGMTIGMTYMMLPYMVLPIWATMRSIDINLMDAARGLGASPAVAFRRIFLPLSAPGIIAGVVLVFTISLGFFVIPRLLGDQSRHVLSSWIFTRFDALLLFGEGSAAALIMMAAVVLVLLAAARFVPLGKILNYDFDQK